MEEKNKENLQILADSAFDSENFQLAYDYFNRLLETDIDNHNNWLKKSYCAAQLSKLDRMLDKEVLMSLNTAFKLSTYRDEELIRISNQISTIIFNKIVEGVKFIQSEIERKFNALQIPAGTLYAVNNVRKIRIQFEVWNDYSAKLFQYFKVMDFVVRMKPTALSCEKGYRSVNYTTHVAQNSGDHFYNLNGNSPESMLLNKLFEFSKSELNRISPNNEVTNPKSTSDSSNCFIATATMGNYNNPIVIELRYFRDSWLLKRLWGQKFTKWYYKNSPKAANKIKESILLKGLTFVTIVLPLYIFSRLINKIRLMA